MITAVVLTKDEEKNIARCLRSLSFCDEILIIDDYSTDKTRAISKKYKTKIIEHELSHDFSKQRNFSLREAKHEWVLFIDADEVVSDALAFEIQEAIKKDFDGFYLTREDMLFGKHLHYGDARVNILRLGKKQKGEWKGKIHEVWNINGRVGSLINPLYHYPHQSISEFLTEINSYTNIRSQELYERGVTAGFLSIIFYTKVKFVQNYFLKQGFRDGLPGFIHGLIMSFHSFLVRGKLWQLKQKKHV